MFRNYISKPVNKPLDDKRAYQDITPRKRTVKGPEMMCSHFYPLRRDICHLVDWYSVSGWL